MNNEQITAARAALDEMDDQARCDVGADCIGPRGVLEAFLSLVEAELTSAPAADAATRGPAADAPVPGVGHPTTYGELARLTPVQLWNRWYPRDRSVSAREAFIAARGIPFVAPGECAPRQPG